MDINRIVEKLMEPYDKALIHLAWLVCSNGKGKGATRYLIFGMVECYPKELTDTLTLPEQDKLFKGGRVFYIRMARPISEAIKWYRTIEQVGYIIVDWNKDGECIDKSDSKKIICGDMKDVKMWPNLVISKKTHDNGNPFIADNWGAVRTHQIFPQRRNSYLLDFISHQNVGTWLERYLTWNISYFPELIGSMNLIFPNPYYSNCDIHMIPKNGSEPDQVKMDFYCRKGIDLSALTVVPFEQDYFGIAGGKDYNIENDSCTITLSGKAEKFGMYVLDADKNIIDFNDFSGFWQGFSFDIFTGYATKEIRRPDKNKCDLVDVYEKVGTVEDGLDSDEEPLGDRLAEAEIRRKRKVETDKHGMRFFYQNHEGAEAYLRNLISKAHKSVLIIDPYCATNELFTYAMSLSVREIEVEIITSKVYLRTPSKLKQYNALGIDVPDLGTELYNQLKDYEKKASGKINILVMTGKDPAIHDRFLVVDDDAWFCGGSLNEVGNRLSCILKLPDSEELVKIIGQIKNSDQVRTLQEWKDIRSETDDADTDGLNTNGVSSNSEN